MGLIRSFRELRVFENAFGAAMEIFELSKVWPREERFELTSQSRRSSRSVCACIAEAWRKRRYPAAFIAKLNDAETEASETRLWLDFALACGYMSPGDHRRLDGRYDTILGQLARMIAQADDWALTASPADAPDASSPHQPTTTKEDPRPEPSAARTIPSSSGTTPQTPP